MKRVCCMGLVVCCLIGVLARAQSQSTSPELSLGIAAYDKQSYKEAIEHLNRAVLIEPESIVAHLYLAKAYDDSNCVACDTWDAEDTAEQRRLLTSAINEYNIVLHLDPSRTEAWNNLSYLFYMSAQYDRAEQAYRSAVNVDPSNRQAVYGVLWSIFRRSYTDLMEKKVKLDKKKRKPLIGSPLCQEYRAKNETQLTESISLLEQLFAARQTYDAAAYLAMMHQLRAEAQCGNRAAYLSEMRLNKHWAERACELHNTGSVEGLGYKTQPAPPPVPRSGRMGRCTWKFPEGNE